MAALSTGGLHLLDHIAPLAALKKIPLIIVEEENAQLAEQYYPGVEIRHVPDLEWKLRSIAEEFGTLYECQYWSPHHKSLGAKLVFCPHGQSDKGYAAPLLAPYALQDHVLLYGPLLKQMLDELQIPLQSYEFIGNYRLQYFEQNKDLLRAHAQKEIFSHLNPKNKTLLYAPTWRDADGATTFFTHAKRLYDELPSDWNLILKIHPNLEERDPALYYRLSLLNRPNFLLVHKFPLIYPILERIDAYLGDYSSVGYDVLAFQKPMFFLLHPHLPKGRLHTCGTILNPAENFFERIDLSNSLQKQQRELYKFAFMI